MLTLSQLEQQALDALQQADNNHHPIARVALLSGGHDSATATLMAASALKELGKPLDAVVHIDTGTGIAETQQYVVNLCREFDLPLRIYRAREYVRSNGTPDPQRYEDFVRQTGFPTAPGHTKMFNRLKDRQLDQMMRDLKQRRRDRILLISGVRREESKRRMVNINASGTIAQQGSRVWVNVIADATGGDCTTFMKRNRIPRNPVRDLLGLSGECLCGAMGSTAEWEITSALFPDDPNVRLISQLHQEVEALGFPWSWGGDIPDWWGVSNRKSELYARWQQEHTEPACDAASPLCHSCNHRSTHCPTDPIPTVESAPSELSTSSSQLMSLPISNLIPTKTLDFGFTLPVMRGVQAGADFYTASVPLKAVVALFQFKEQELPDEIRAQRPLNEKRGEQIAKYMLLHPNSYVFPAITAAISSSCTFTPLTDGADIGYLKIPPGTIPVCDGQHRLLGIDTVLADDPRFENEAIAVTFFVADTLERRQQIFAHINRYAQKPTSSTNRAYDLEDLEAQRSKHIKNAIPLFRVLVDEHRTSIRGNTIKLFPLAGFDDATRTLLGGSTLPESSQTDLAVQFWTQVAEAVPAWHSVYRGELSAAEVRKSYVHHLAVVLIAIAQVGHDLIEQDNWEATVGQLAQIDWSIANPDWQTLFIFGGKVQKGHKYSTALAGYLRDRLGV